MNYFSIYDVSRSCIFGPIEYMYFHIGTRFVVNHFRFVYVILHLTHNLFMLPPFDDKGNDRIYLWENMFIIFYMINEYCI